LWRQGHQTFSGFIKARERPGKGGGFWGRRNRKINPKTKKKQRKLNKKPRIKTQAKPIKGLSNRGGGAENQREEDRKRLGGKDEPE
jgi:hypothetical protein